VIAVDRRFLRNFDWFFFALVIAVCLLGLQNLYSASVQTGLFTFKRQVVWFVLGAFASFSVSLIDYRVLERYAHHLYVLCMFFLLAVLFVGKEVAGSTSWISIGGAVSIQPSEFAKIAVVLALARFYGSDYEGGPYSLADLIKPMAAVGVPVGLILLQPDLGTSLMVLLISATIVLFMGVRIKSLLLLAVLIAGLCYPTWNYLLKDYQRERIMTFLDPSRDPLGAGYNAIQSKVAVGSGGLLGKGFMQGSQTQLRFIPEQQTDFAFSVIAEEWGFIGAAFTVVLYFLLILWSLDAASRARDKFSGVVCIGVAAMFFWHTVVNVGMVTGLLPVAGVPLLLFSYGGSSFLSAMIAVGLVLGVKVNRFRASGDTIEHA